VSATTISAVLGKLGGISAHYDVLGRLESAQAFDDLDDQLGGVTLDIDHNHEPAGEIAYVEVSPEGQLGLVGVVGGDWLQEAAEEQPVYVSGEFATFNRSSAGSTYIAERAALLSAALTWTPARVGDARPAKLWPGDVRRSSDRRSWPISFARQDPLLGRAVDHGSWATETGRVVDLRVDDDSLYGVLGLKPGDPAPGGSYRSTNLPGGLRYGAPGRILSVR
jgi:hypothetical protein